MSRQTNGNGLPYQNDSKQHYNVNAKMIAMPRKDHRKPYTSEIAYKSFLSFIHFFSSQF